METYCFRFVYFQCKINQGNWKFDFVLFMVLENGQRTLWLFTAFRVKQFAPVVGFSFYQWDDYNSYWFTRIQAAFINPQLSLLFSLYLLRLHFFLLLRPRVMTSQWFTLFVILTHLYWCEIIIKFENVTWCLCSAMSLFVSCCCFWGGSKLLKQNYKKTFAMNTCPLWPSHKWQNIPKMRNVSSYIVTKKEGGGGRGDEILGDAGNK